MKTLDIDGTLLDYDYIPSAPPKINWGLISALSGETIALVTNQGGLAFGEMGAKRKDGRSYPRPGDFLHRLNRLLVALRKMNVEVTNVQVCVYHPKATTESIALVAEKLDILLNTIVDANIYVSENERKPSPFMLKAANATSYYGDSDEDEKAAIAAEIPFYRVERFT